MSARRSGTSALAGALLLTVLVGGVFIAAGVWPGWLGRPLLAVFFGSTWWALAREARRGPLPPEETAAEDATREAEQGWPAAALREEVVEHTRVERVLTAILKREGVPYDYARPIGGHMDVREGTFSLAAPLPVTAADLAALNGPITRFQTVTAPDGSVVLTHLSARDSNWGGIEAHVPAP